MSILAGEIMLANGAETYRIEDVMRRVLRSCGYANAEAFAVSTVVHANMNNEEGEFTGFRVVSGRRLNLGVLIKMNDLSRSFAEGRITPQETLKAMQELQREQKHPATNSSFTKLFAAGAACAGFTYLFGGGFLDCLNAFFTGFILQILLLQLRKYNVNEVLVHIIGGGMISFLVLSLVNLGISGGLDMSHDYIIIGSLMIMVPGVTLTNAVRDVFAGDYLSGSVRLLDALVVAISLAVGVGSVMLLWFRIFGGVFI